jgi:abequosyltransferase
MNNIANNEVSLTIPTYNRARFLDACLEYHIPLARKYNVKIFISDNASTDNTEEIVRKRIEEYPLIFYSKNKKNIGPDEGFEKALKFSDTKYAWLLGDTYKIPPEGLSYLFELLKLNPKSYDLIVLNCANRVKDVPNQDYIDPNKIFCDLAWHMTCLSVLVYSQRLIKNSNFRRYQNTNFIQSGIIFEYLACNDFLVHWNMSLSVDGITLPGIEKISWLKYTFEIWTERWANFIFSLPPIYTITNKIKVIKSHGVKSSLFSFNGLLMLRARGILNLTTYSRFSQLFFLSIPFSKYILFLLCLVPLSFFQVIIFLYKFILRLKKFFNE